jgi:outer membrane protein assembly factor BamB
VVIDLGELTGAEGLPPPAPVRLTRRLIRQIAVSVVAVLTLGTVTASIPPNRPEIRQLWSAPFGEGDASMLTGSTLYLSRGTAGNPTLTAYDLATGRVRWRTSTGDPVNGLLPVTDGVLLMPESVGDVRIRQDDGSFLNSTQITRTLARDSDTGRLLWSQGGDVMREFGDSVLLGESDDQGRLTRMRVIGLRDGVTRWSRPVRGVEGWDVAKIGGRPAQIVLTDAAGALTLLDYADGQTVRTGKLLWHGPPQQQDSGVSTDLVMIGDYLVISRSDNTAQVSTVYRLATLQELWHVDGFVLDCGPALCTMDGSGLVGRDPATGRPRWRVPGMANVWNLGHGRILADSPSARGPHQVIDAASGRTIGYPVRGDATWVYAPLPRSVMILGIEATDPGASTVIRLDLDTGAPSLLGTIKEADYYGCQGVPGYLTCVRPGKLEVTAVG